MEAHDTPPTKKKRVVGGLSRLLGCSTEETTSRRGGEEEVRQAEVGLDGRVSHHLAGRQRAKAGVVDDVFRV